MEEKDADLGYEQPLAVRDVKFWRRGVAVIFGLQFVVILVFVTRSYFMRDDLLFFTLFESFDSLDYSVLTRDYFEHLIPGFAIVNWIFAKYLNSNWAAAVVFMVAAQLAGTFAMSRLLLAISNGMRRWHVPILALFSFSIVLINNAGWFGASISNQLPTVLLVATFASFFRYSRDRRGRDLLLAFLAFTLAVSFSEKLIVGAVFVGLFVLIVGKPESSLVDRILDAVSLWRLWLVMLPAVLFVALSYLLREDLGPSGDSSSRSIGIATIVGKTASVFFNGLCPALFGILNTTPGGVYGLLLWLVPSLLVLSLIVYTLAKSRFALRVWIWFGLCFAGSIGLLISARYALIGDFLLTELRYLGDSTVLFLIALAVIAQNGRLMLPRIRTGWWVLLGLVYALLVASSLTQIGAYGRSANAYVMNLRSSYEKLIESEEIDGLLRRELRDPIVLPGIPSYSQPDEILIKVDSDIQFVTDPRGAGWLGSNGMVQPLETTRVLTLQSDTTCNRQYLPVKDLGPTGELVAGASYLLQFDYAVAAPTEIRIIGVRDGQPVLLHLPTRQLALNPKQQTYALELPSQGLDGLYWDVLSGSEACLSEVQIRQVLNPDASLPGVDAP